MTFIRATVLGAALLVGGVASAGAADLYNGRGGSIKDGYAPAGYSSPMGFYLRGDATYSWNDVGSMFEPPVGQLSDVGTSNSWMFGAGVGYHFTKHVRADITYDFGRSHNAHGTELNPNATFPGVRNFGLKSDVLLANVYYDFGEGHHSRFSPYLGVGLGVARNTTSGGVISTCGCTTASFDGASTWSTAAALMAGVTIQLRERLSLDAGYRFLYTGDAHTGDITGTGGVGGNPSSADPHVRDLWSHQLRVGVRYDIR